MMRTLAGLIVWGASVWIASAQQKPTCQSATFRASLLKHGATVLSTTSYARNAYQYLGSSNNIPFCAIDASINYGGNDTLLFSVWLPDESDFKGRFIAVGNGGMAGSTDYANMLTQLNSGLGFAVAGGNAGHLASLNNNGLGVPGVYLPYLHDRDEVKAWIHNAISLFTPAAKAVVVSSYKAGVKHSYYIGCSTGGAQGFALAQFHPKLFDGIIAGSPGNWYSHLILSFLWNAQHIQNGSVDILSQDALSVLTNASIKACDGNDGVHDGLIENPLRCRLNINALACSDPNSNDTTCLRSDQIAAAKAIYEGPSRTCGKRIYPGFAFGSETGWNLQPGVSQLFAIPILQNLVYDDLSYNADTFNWDSDVDDVDRKAGVLIDEISPDLSDYFGREGKLLVTQGWADQLNSALWPIQHLEQIQRKVGRDISDFFNLFMIPGGGHCGASAQYPAVPATYHTVSKMVQWVERGHKPEYVLSTNPPDGSDTTRRLCPWPRTAKYTKGDTSNWRSYVCR